MDFSALVELVLSTLGTLVGFPVLLAVILTGLEYFGHITENIADKINFWANAVLFVGIFGLAITGNIELVNEIDNTLGQLAQVLLQVLILLGVPAGFLITKGFHSKSRETTFVAPRLMGKRTK